ncbi:MAG: hypothetical protein P8M34_10925 [Saprospiraceae bacterium]|nr:hypothetical protein [Saprospiraceae bacterium]
MRFREGLMLGAKGGHGPIKYIVKRIVDDQLVEFQFTSPNNFDGIHKLEFFEENDSNTTIRHTIDMETRGVLATLQWLVAIKHLHDALIEDAFDKVENLFNSTPKKTRWSSWVKTLRWLLG